MTSSKDKDVPASTCSTSSIYEVQCPSDYDNISAYAAEIGDPVIHYSVDMK